MANRKIKHIVAKLVGASSEETLDVYDVDAVHTDQIANNLTTTDSGYVLDARQGKALNDSLSNLTTYVSGTVSWFGTGGVARRNYVVRRGNVVSISYNVYNVSNVAAQGNYWSVNSTYYAPTATRYILGSFIDTSNNAIPATYEISTTGLITILHSSSVYATQFAFYGTYLL